MTIDSSPSSRPSPTDRMQDIIEAAEAAGDDLSHPDFGELSELAWLLSMQRDHVSPSDPDALPFLVLGSDDQPFLYWARTPEEAAVADLVTEAGEVEYEHWEDSERAARRARDAEDLFASQVWESWTVRVYSVLYANLGRRSMPVFGDDRVGSRLPLVGKFFAHAYWGDE